MLPGLRKKKHQVLASETRGLETTGTCRTGNLRKGSRKRVKTTGQDGAKKGKNDVAKRWRFQVPQVSHRESRSSRCVCRYDVTAPSQATSARLDDTKAKYDWCQRKKAMSLSGCASGNTLMSTQYKVLGGQERRLSVLAQGTMLCRCWWTSAALLSSREYLSSSNIWRAWARGIPDLQRLFAFPA